MSPARRKNCLLISLQAPRAPGGGGEVRSHFLVLAATELFDVTLISLGGSDAAGRVPPALVARCQKVIEPDNVSRQDQFQHHPGRPGRLTAWGRLLRQGQQAQPGIGRWYLERQTLMMKRMEFDAWRSVSLIIQCSQADARVTKQQIPQAIVLEMPNGVAPQYFTRTSPRAV